MLVKSLSELLPISHANRSRFFCFIVRWEDYNICGKDPLTLPRRRPARGNLTRSPPRQWQSIRAWNATERLQAPHPEIILPCANRRLAVLALLASSQIVMQIVDV
jgi:hypothetical protein